MYARYTILQPMLLAHAITSYYPVGKYVTLALFVEERYKIQQNLSTLKIHRNNTCTFKFLFRNAR